MLMITDSVPSTNPFPWQIIWYNGRLTVSGTISIDRYKTF